MSPTNHHKYKYFHSTVQQAKDRRQKFYFCRLPFDVRPRNVKLNLSNVNVFNSVTSARVLSYRWVLHYFSTIPVGRIKTVTVYKRSIFQVEWLIVTLILCISHCSESDSVSNRVFCSAVSTAPRFLLFFSFVGDQTQTSARPNTGREI